MKNRWPKYIAICVATQIFSGLVGLAIFSLVFPSIKDSGLGAPLFTLALFLIVAPAIGAPIGIIGSYLMARWIIPKGLKRWPVVLISTIPQTLSILTLVSIFGTASISFVFDGPLASLKLLLFEPKSNDLRVLLEKDMIRQALRVVNSSEFNEGESISAIPALGLAICHSDKAKLERRAQIIKSLLAKPKLRVSYSPVAGWDPLTCALSLPDFELARQIIEHPNFTPDEQMLDELLSLAPYSLLRYTFEKYPDFEGLLFKEHPAEDHYWQLQSAFQNNNQNAFGYVLSLCLRRKGFVSNLWLANNRLQKSGNLLSHLCSDPSLSQYVQYLLAEPNLEILSKDVEHCKAHPLYLKIQKLAEKK